MPLLPGHKLGPYEILAPIGAGGMGEVYRARDGRLGREVALKILPADLANVPSRRQRFELESSVVAALNHPNIVCIYDVGDEAGFSFIVIELVDGEPLLARKFGLRKTLDFGVQIANGLAAAHDAGITHRDLKPDNILLTRDGRIKILDFGLAKLTVARAAATATETVTVHTEPGVVMGTVGYMSPEQVRGNEVDRRSDICYSHLSAGSWNDNGRLLATLHESWFAAPAVLDTRNGRVQALPSDKASDYVSMVWLPDGRMMALRIGNRSTLWRFAAEREHAR